MMKTSTVLVKILLLLLATVLVLCACEPAGTSNAGETTASSTTTGTLTEGTTAADETTGKTDPNGSETQEPGAEGLLLSYDDRYSFPTEIKEIKTLEVTSKSLATGEADSAVLTLVVGSQKQVIATGTGSAEVIFTDGTSETVTVGAAPLSLLFVFGQSNGEGMINTNADDCTAARLQSVICEEGQVYSTYAPYHLTHGANIGGVTFSEVLSTASAKSFVAESLTSNKNVNGKVLEYPLDQLSRANGGKSGMDSAIAYEWHRNTGDKVWVVNASHCGSAISSWQPGESETDNNFWQAMGVAAACQATLTAEIEAGHYTFSRMGYFWLQGCADRTMTSAQYTEAYEAMHKGFIRELEKDMDGDGENEALDFGGIVLVRHPVTSFTPLDLELNGPRTSQIFMGTSSEKAYQTVYLASTLGDLFVSDLNVENYFKAQYPAGEVSFPTRQSYPLPETAAEVHPDIHYRQPGYNALGMDAVRNILELLEGKQTDAEAVRVYQPNGYTPYKDGDTLVFRVGDTQNIAALAAAGGYQAKDITFETTCKGLFINQNTIRIAGDANGASGVLKVLCNGELVLTLNVSVQ